MGYLIAGCRGSFLHWANCTYASAEQLNQLFLDMKELERKCREILGIPPETYTKNIPPTRKSLQTKGGSQEEGASSMIFRQRLWQVSLKEEGHLVVFSIFFQASRV